MEPPLAALREPSPKVGDSPDERALARLRWRCRRGMLENDLILERFLDARAGSLTAADVAALDALLDHGDNELWDLLSARTEPADAALAPLLECLRSI
ncbi:MAG TPA: succinate dehydrogenase assembly factor 2 [Casimicrobiaceae bacterium]|jgi:antitoxin CptB